MPENSVTIKSNKLVCSLPLASDPVVWTMDLEAYNSCSFEVKKSGKKFVLVMKNDAGERHDIAKFDDKDDAVKTLIEVTEALENTQNTKSKNTKNKTKPEDSRKTKNRLLTVMILVGFILLITYMWGNAIRNVVVINDREVLSASSAGTNLPASQQSGVPVSADDFLSGQ